MNRIFAAAALTLLYLAPAFSAPMNARVRSVPKEIQQGVFENPQEALPLLVKNLAGSSSSAAEKVKILHDWICDNIAYDTAVFFGEAGAQDCESVLKKKKAVCAGYTNLMNAMCSLAGIESVGISGYSKGFGYRGFIEEGQQPDHAWNAVKLGSRWQLVDVTWDAGFVDYKTFIKQYSTDYLCLSPQQFAFSHLPQDESFQYLAEPKTRETFVREPYIPGKFFALGLALGENKPEYTNSISAAARYDFRISKQGVLITGDVLSADGGQSIENASWAERSGAKAAVAFDVPDTKAYRARVLARQKTDTRLPLVFSIEEFEREVIPAAQQLLSQKKITQAEYAHFEQAYFKVAENGRYYHAENMFATARNAAAAKILRLAEKNSPGYEEVISFTIKADGGYNGYGGNPRFPAAYSAFMDTKNTHLISPDCGALETGGTYTFALRTSEFAAAGIVIDDDLVPFAKNPASGAFELEFTVPNGCTKIPVFASKNGRNFSGLYMYAVK